MPKYKRLFIENANVFLTINTYNKRPILVDNIELLRESFKRAKQVYDFKIYACVILPDHIHMILQPANIKEYPKIIFAIKYHFSRHLKNNGGIGIPPYISNSKIKKGENGIWQRRYWEHTIINEKDLYRHLDYIHYNPLKHGYVKMPKDWKFSSFNKFVKMNFYELDWYCQENLEEILALDLG